MDISLNLHDNELFLQQFPFSSFLQSRFWAHFLTLQGKKNWQLNVYSGQRIVAHCLLYTTPLIAGKSYLYAPRGPLILPSLDEEDRRMAIELILSQIRDITIATRRREEIFCRLEPNVQTTKLKDIAFHVTEPVQPAQTLYLHLPTDPKKIFSTFKEKTRYNIRLAQKKNIAIHWSQDEKDLHTFLSLLTKTAQRQKIQTHDKKYYLTLLKAGKRYRCVWLQWAAHNKKIIAANIYVGMAPTMTYLHGAFDYRYRDLMAPYLLQWEAIKKAINKNFDYYDFWGIAPADGSKPNWEGFTRFKRGFAGKEITFPGTYDFTYNQVWYNMYRHYLKMKTMLRS